MKRQLLIDYRGKRSQAKMAAIYGITQQAWSFWENGSCLPTPDKMKLLADDIGVPIETIFADAFNKHSQKQS